MISPETRGEILVVRRTDPLAADDLIGINLIDLLSGALGALAQALFLKPGVGQGTDDQALFLPSPRLARLLLTALGTGVCKADCVRQEQRLVVRSLAHA